MADAQRGAFFVLRMCKVEPAEDDVQKLNVNTSSSSTGLGADVIPTPRSGHRCVTDDANLFSFGGYNPTFVPHQPLFRELWRFNLATRKWTKVETTGPAPKELASHAALLHGQYLMVYGGTGIPFGSASSNNLHLCDLTTYTWTKVDATGQLPPKLYGQALALFDGRLYVYGGTTGFEYTSDVHCLNLKSKMWTELKVANPERKPTERYRHEIACLDRKLFVFGGGRSTENFGFQTIPTFDVDSYEWTSVPTIADDSVDVEAQPGIPSARKFHSLVQRDKDVYICGGYNDESIFNDVWRLSLTSMQWTRLSCVLPQPVFFHAATLTSTGCMYVFGGVTNINQKERTADVYSVWLTIPSLREMSWQMVLSCIKDASSISRTSWLQLGVPIDLVNRIDQRANFG